MDEILVDELKHNLVEIVYSSPYEKSTYTRKENKHQRKASAHK